MNLLAQSSTTTASDPSAALAALFGGSFLLFGLIICVIMIAVYYVILKKTGYNPWLSLLILIPGIGGLIILIMLVFTEWPVEREVKALRAQLGGGGYAPGGYAPAAGYAPPAGGPITPA